MKRTALLFVLSLSAISGFAQDTAPSNGQQGDPGFGNTTTTVDSKFGHKAVAEVLLNGQPICSAFLSSQCVLVTASHCFHTERNVSRGAGKRKEGKITVRFPRSQVQHEVEYDWQPKYKGRPDGRMIGEVTGLILKKPIKDIEPFELSGTENADIKELQNQKMEMLGHVNGRFISSSCAQIKIDPKTREVSGCDLIPGMSGGPCIVKGKPIGTNSFHRPGVLKNGVCVLLPRRARAEIARYQGEKCEKTLSSR